MTACCCCPPPCAGTLVLGSHGATSHKLVAIAAATNKLRWASPVGNEFRCGGLALLPRPTPASPPLIVHAAEFAKALCVYRLVDGVRVAVRPGAHHMFLAVDPASGIVFAGDHAAPYGVSMYAWVDPAAAAAAAGPRRSETPPLQQQQTQHQQPSSPAAAAPGASLRAPLLRQASQRQSESQGGAPDIEAGEGPLPLLRQSSASSNGLVDATGAFGEDLPLLHRRLSRASETRGSGGSNSGGAASLNTPTPDPYTQHQQHAYPHFDAVPIPQPRLGAYPQPCLVPLGPVEAVAGVGSHFRPLCVVPGVVGPHGGSGRSHLVVGAMGQSTLLVVALPSLALVHTHVLAGVRVGGLAADPRGQRLLVVDTARKRALHVLQWPLPGMPALL